MPSRRDARSHTKPPEHAPFLERPVAIVTLIGGLLGIVTALVALVGLPGGNGGTRTERINACVAEHGLRSPAEKDKLASDRMVFRGCVWPSPLGADPDGFFEITAYSRPGPGKSEAEGLTISDVFSSPCRDIEVRYLFDNMGTFIPEQPVRLTKGEIRRVEGGSIWFPRNESQAQIYTPGRDQFAVLSARRYRVDSARCIELQSRPTAS